MKLYCMKCQSDQEMKKIYYGAKNNEYSWYCPKCKDKISQSAVRGVK